MLGLFKVDKISFIRVQSRQRDIAGPWNRHCSPIWAVFSLRKCRCAFFFYNTSIVQTKPPHSLYKPAGNIMLNTANSSFFLISFRFLWHTLPALFLYPPLSVLSSLPSHARHEWRQTASLAAARMRQQLILGCPPSLLKGRYRVSNSSSWLDTMEISVQGQSSKQVN